MTQTQAAMVLEVINKACRTNWDRRRAGDALRPMFNAAGFDIGRRLTPRRVELCLMLLEPLWPK